MLLCFDEGHCEINYSFDLLRVYSYRANIAVKGSNSAKKCIVKITTAYALLQFLQLKHYMSIVYLNGDDSRNIMYIMRIRKPKP